MTLFLHDKRNLEKDDSTPANVVIYNDPEQIIFYLDANDDEKSVTITRTEWGSWQLQIYKKGKPIDKMLLE